MPPSTSSDFLSYDVQGQGETVLMLHGLGAHRGTWDDILPFLVGRARVIRADLLGFGASPKPRDDHYGLLDHVAAVRSLLDAIGERELSLVGHSFGGAVSLLVASEEPERIRKLVIIDSPAYPEDVPWPTKLLKLPLAGPVFLRIPVSLLLPFFLRRIYRRREVLSPERIAKYKTPLTSPGTRHAILETALHAISDPLDELAARHRNVSIPTLLIWGRHDRVIPLRTAERLEHDLPNARLVVMAQCGHAPHEEDPEETAKAIVAFLDSAS